MVEDSGIVKFDHTKLTCEAEKVLEEPEELIRLFEAKQALIKIVDEALEKIINIPEAGLRRNRCSAWLTTYELLLAHIIRDDSPLAEKGAAGLKEALESVCAGASLREFMAITPAAEKYVPFSDGVSRLKSAQDRYRSVVASAPPQAPNPIRIWSGASPRFKRYGVILELPDEEVTEFFRADPAPVFYVNGQVTGLRIGSEGVWEAGRIVMKERPFSIYIEDFHHNTEEVLVPDKPTILQVDSPTAEPRPYFNGELFYVPRGVVIYINREVRHFAPLPVLTGATTSPVIFRLATTTDAKDFHHNKFEFVRRIL